MQIDFHHAVTYVVSRLAGLSKEDADIVAYSAQYVDDATNAGVIKFDNGATYMRISPAHKMLDYRNFDQLANHRCWLPFHFLPGNDLKPAGENIDRDFVYKTICKPGSYVAKDMVAAAIRDKDKPYGLQRLGITMHTFVDTWAHYGFTGMQHEINKIRDINVANDNHHYETFSQKMKLFFSNLVDDTKGLFVGNVLPLGHGAVLSYPDRPYLRWSYVNGLGEEIIRDNQHDYIIAVEEMFKAIKQFIAANPGVEITDTIPEQDMKTIKELLWENTKEDGEERHQDWLEAIKNGRFSFGAEDVSYIAKGENSWKHKAIGTLKSKDDKDEIFCFTPEFLNSNWKKFHDAAQAHRFEILHHILPRYGICAG